LFLQLIKNQKGISFGEGVEVGEILNGKAEFNALLKRSLVRVSDSILDGLERSFVNIGDLA
jgi:hypothetical protein